MVAATETIIKEVNLLIQLDIDAIHLYESAIKKVSLIHVKSQLELFKADHENHVTRLSECVQRMGGQAPEYKQDLKGRILEGFTTVRSMTGTEGALKAMRMNEVLTNRTYESALSFDLPADILAIVRQNREDERRHLKYIETCIDQKIWESEAKAA